MPSILPSPPKLGGLYICAAGSSRLRKLSGAATTAHPPTHPPHMLSARLVGSPGQHQQALCATIAASLAEQLLASSRCRGVPPSRTESALPAASVNAARVCIYPLLASS